MWSANGDPCNKNDGRNIVNVKNKCMLSGRVRGVLVGADNTAIECGSGNTAGNKISEHKHQQEQGCDRQQQGCMQGTCV